MVFNSNLIVNGDITIEYIDVNNGACHGQCGKTR
jgi:hypothetical protein